MLPGTAGSTRSARATRARAIVSKESGREARGGGRFSLSDSRLGAARSPRGSRDPKRARPSSVGGALSLSREGAGEGESGRERDARAAAAAAHGGLFSLVVFRADTHRALTVNVDSHGDEPPNVLRVAGLRRPSERLAVLLLPGGGGG